MSTHSSFHLLRFSQDMRLLHFLFGPLDHLLRNEGIRLHLFRHELRDDSFAHGHHHQTACQASQRTDQDAGSHVFFHTRLLIIAG
jgi:hypothetical protein